jgi:hypothetical protein
LDLQTARASFGAAPLNSTSTNVALGLRHTRDRRLVSGAFGAPLGSDDLTWGVVAGQDRMALRRGRFEAGLEISGMAHAQRDPSTEQTGAGLRAEALPLVSTSIGSLVAELRGGGSWYQGRIDDERWSRNLLLSDLSLTMPVSQRPGRSLHLGSELRHLRGFEADESYAWLGGSASAGLRRSSAWVAAGRWLDLPGGDEASGTGIGGGISVALSARMSVSAQLRREAFDPVFLSTDRTSWGVAFSYRLGSPQPPPPSAGAEVRDGSQVTIRVPLSESGSPPSVAGDFSDWQPLPMHRNGSRWEVTLELSPGLYHYAFRTRDGRWFVPEDVPGRRDDGMGGWVATLVVPQGAR